MTAPSIVQSTSVNANTVTNVSKAFTSGNTLGNTLIVIVGHWRNGTLGTITISDTLLQSYSLLGSSPLASVSGQSQLSVFILQNCGAGANTIKAQSTQTEDICLDIIEINNVPTSGVPDGFAANVFTGTLATSSDITTVNAVDLLFAVVFNQSTSNTLYTATPSGFALLQNNSDAVGGMDTSIFTMSVAATGTYAASFSLAISSNGMHAAIFAISNTTVTPAAQVSFSAGSQTFSSMAQSDTPNLTQGFSGVFIAEVVGLAAVGNANITGNNMKESTEQLLNGWQSVSQFPKTGQLFPTRQW
jgi:hypothetical protein